MEKSAEKIIEEAIGELYRGFHRLRKAEKYQEEYDTMGVLVNMLCVDRDHLRRKYKVE